MHSALPTISYMPSWCITRTSTGATSSFPFQNPYSNYHFSNRYSSHIVSAAFPK